LLSTGFSFRFKYSLTHLLQFDNQSKILSIKECILYIVDWHPSVGGFVAVTGFNQKIAVFDVPWVLVARGRNERIFRKNQFTGTSGYTFFCSFSSTVYEYQATGNNLIEHPE
jgi:hypothetical protein